MKNLIAVLLVSCLTGCGTFFSKVGDDGRYWGNTYSGVRCSSQMMSTSLSGTTSLLFFPLTLVDMVLSAVADTLLLPIDWSIEPTTENILNPCNLVGAS